MSGAAHLYAEIDRLIESDGGWLVETRHHLHAHPELSNREQHTAAFVADRLRSFGLDEVRTGLGGHGIVGVLRGGLPGDRVIGLRADMDALPIREDTGLDFASEVVDDDYPGGPFPVAHACGHDCHVAIVLSAAKLLAGLRDRLPGTVVFIFQPSEEGAPFGETAGALAMIRDGGLAGVEPTMVFALHVVYLPKGVIGYHVGNQYAASCTTKVVLRGVQVHGSSPWMGVDPMPAAAQIILGVGQLYRQVPATNAVAATIGHVEDVGRFNVIGESVTLWGTLRANVESDMVTLKERFDRLARGAAATYGCEAEVEYFLEYPACHNSAAWMEAAMPTLTRVVGTENLVDQPPLLGADDMAEFIKAYGGLYLTYGVQDTRFDGDQLVPIEGGRGLAPNHHPSFYADDDSLAGSVRVHAHVAVDHLFGVLTTDTSDGSTPHE